MFVFRGAGGWSAKRSNRPLTMVGFLRAFGGTESGPLDLLVAKGVDGVDPRDDGECVFNKGAAGVSEVPVSDAVRVDGKGTVEKEMPGVFSGCGFSLERSASAVGVDGIEDAKCVFIGAASVSEASREDGEGTVEKEMPGVFSGCGFSLERSASAVGVDGIEDAKCVFKGAASVSEASREDGEGTVEKEMPGVFSGCEFSLERSASVVGVDGIEDAKCVFKGAASVSEASREDGEGTVEKETWEVSSDCSEKGSPRD
ncbi:hypothetical protein GGX14DRAFT_404503 [Mycena pura]|uniref:Uncharacterized protein n=1 Tax=Mycena pura TaxID=153505 RepID=A0AAD6UUB9_9AGAR|nr:hypothetical protein GGX14DRAFT_404503 [Mycena pura]